MRRDLVLVTLAALALTFAPPLRRARGYTSASAHRRPSLRGGWPRQARATCGFRATTAGTATHTSGSQVGGELPPAHRGRGCPATGVRHRHNGWYWGRGPLALGSLRPQRPGSVAPSAGAHGQRDIVASLATAALSLICTWGMGLSESASTAILRSRVALNPTMDASTSYRPGVVMAKRANPSASAVADRDSDDLPDPRTLTAAPGRGRHDPSTT